MIPIKMMSTAFHIPSLKILARLRHKTAIDRTAVTYIPHAPNSANEAATLKKIKNSVDKWNCMGKTISIYRIALKKLEIIRIFTIFNTKGRNIENTKNKLPIPFRDFVLSPFRVKKIVTYGSLQTAIAQSINMNSLKDISNIKQKWGGSSTATPRVYMNCRSNELINSHPAQVPGLNHYRYMTRNSAAVITATTGRGFTFWRSFPSDPRCGRSSPIRCRTRRGLLAAYRPLPRSNRRRRPSCGLRR